MGTAIKHPVPDRVKTSFVIFDIRLSVRVPGCQKLQMSRSGTGCFIARPMWQQWASGVKTFATTNSRHWPSAHLRRLRFFELELQWRHEMLQFGHARWQSLMTSAVDVRLSVGVWRRVTVTRPAVWSWRRNCRIVVVVVDQVVVRLCCLHTSSVHHDVTPRISMLNCFQKRSI